MLLYSQSLETKVPKHKFIQYRQGKNKPEEKVWNQLLGTKSYKKEITCKVYLIINRMMRNDLKKKDNKNKNKVSQESWYTPIIPPSWKAESERLF